MLADFKADLLISQVRNDSKPFIFQGFFYFKAIFGLFFCDIKDILKAANKTLRFSAGNYYVNDKPTGAVVGQQPFGGARASGTNDKAGSMFNLIRWVSQRTIKENFEPPTDYKYPFMGEDE